MKQYFKQFEEKLQTAEEKLDILSDWHIAKGHKGATEIAEECRAAITSLWMEFYGLSEAYKEAEADHEEIKRANIQFLFDEFNLIDNSVKHNPDFPARFRGEYLADLLKKVADESDRELYVHGTPEEQEYIRQLNLWAYIKKLIIKDQKERGIL